jgi:hypothetical protein
MTRACYFKIALIVFIFIVGPCACNPCGEVPRHFTVKSISAANFHSPLGGSDPIQSVPPGAEVAWNNYALDVPFNVEYTAGLSGGAALYATSCVDPGESGANTGIKDIYVIALDDYNENYHENDTLNAVVKIGVNTNYLMSMSDFKLENSPTLYAQRFVVKLLQAPSADKDDYQFKVVMHLLNGDIFTATSSPITLLK